MIHLSANTINEVTCTCSELMLSPGTNNVLFHIQNARTYEDFYCVTTGNTSPSPGRYDLFNINVVDTSTTSADTLNATVQLKKDGQYIYTAYEWRTSDDINSLNLNELRQVETGFCIVTGNTEVNSVYL